MASKLERLNAIDLEIRECEPNATVLAQLAWAFRAFHRPRRALELFSLVAALPGESFAVRNASEEVRRITGVPPTGAADSLTTWLFAMFWKVLGVPADSVHALASVTTLVWAIRCSLLLAAILLSAALLPRVTGAPSRRSTRFEHSTTWLGSAVAIAAYLAVTGVLQAVAATVRYHYSVTDGEWASIEPIAVSVVAGVIPMVVLWRGRQVGLKSTSRMAAVWIGTATVATSAAVMWLGYKQTTGTPDTSWSYPLVGEWTPALFAIGAAVEELIHRALLFRTLRTVTVGPIAYLLTVLFFVGFHWPWAGCGDVLLVAVAGLAYSLAYDFLGGLIASTSLHIAFNSLLYIVGS